MIIEEESAPPELIKSVEKIVGHPNSARINDDYCTILKNELISKGLVGRISSVSKYKKACLNYWRESIFIEYTSNGIVESFRAHFSPSPDEYYLIKVGRKRGHKVKFDLKNRRDEMVQQYLDPDSGFFKNLANLWRKGLEANSRFDPFMMEISDEKGKIDYNF
jgi:hypothetical protein